MCFLAKISFLPFYFWTVDCYLKKSKQLWLIGNAGFFELYSFYLVFIFPSLQIKGLIFSVLFLFMEKLYELFYYLCSLFSPFIYDFMWPYRKVSFVCYLKMLCSGSYLFFFWWWQLNVPWRRGNVIFFSKILSKLWPPSFSYASLLHPYNKYLSSPSVGC